MLVAEDAVTVALTPLKNCTTGEAPKSVPEITMEASTAPLAGENPPIIGVLRTVKSSTLVPVSGPTVTDIGPVVAPTGTVVVNSVVDAAVTTAAVPLKLTALLAGSESSKPVPVIITVAPAAPL
jgi:hypothetical protein